ncbi:MAG: hypothetical protein J6T88_03595 [Bacteroidales bacterium]|nr:hypothetical protein [Bacteroidales bacterium]
MKNKTLFVVAAAIGAMLCVSCGPKEGVIGKKHKIDQIMAVDSHYQDDRLLMTTDTYIEQKWNWDGKEMYRIDYHGGEHPYSEVFFYDGRKIIRTTVPAYSIRSEFFYDGRKLERIEVYDKDELYCNMAFIHDGKQLTGISCNYYTVSDTNNAILEKMANPLRSLVGDEVAMCLNSENCQRIARQKARSSKSSVNVRYEIAWNDDNPTQIVCSDAEGQRTIRLQYDSKENPFYQLYGFHELNDPIFGFAMLSKNNVLAIRMPYKRNNNQLFKYRYEYDGDVVAKRWLSYSYPSVDYTTLDSVTYKFEKAEEFSYIED